VTAAEFRARAIHVLKPTLLWLAAGYFGIKAIASVSPWSLGINNTPSLPVGLYLKEKITPNEPVSVGDWVCHSYNPPEWAAQRNYAPREVPVCKPIAALPGYKLEVTDATIKVFDKLGALQAEYPYEKTDSKGRSIPLALTTATVAENQIVLITPYVSRGLDSRYIGPRWRHEITTRIYPLITWVAAP
jgi:type IV secretory pathway protease TraF